MATLKFLELWAIIAVCRTREWIGSEQSSESGPRFLALL